MSNSIKITLTEEQHKHYETVRWLLGDGHVASGRTTVMAYVFLEKAFDNLGIPVFVFDHITTSRRREMISKIIRVYEDGDGPSSGFVLSVNREKSSIMIKRES